MKRRVILASIIILPLFIMIWGVVSQPVGSGNEYTQQAEQICSSSIWGETAFYSIVFGTIGFFIYLCLNSYLAYKKSLVDEIQDRHTRDRLILSQLGELEINERLIRVRSN